MGERALKFYRRRSGESDGGFLFLGGRVLMREMYRKSEGTGEGGFVEEVDVRWG